MLLSNTIDLTGIRPSQKYEVKMASFESIQQEIAAMLDVADDEFTAEQRAAMDAYLDELATQEADKVDRFAAFIREEAAHAKFMREESQRLASKARNAENRINYLKYKYVSIMQEHGLEKITGQAYSLSIRHTPTAVIEDDSNLDDLYFRIVPAKRELDKKVILEALKGGVEIPGCKLVQLDSLQIR